LRVLMWVCKLLHDYTPCIYHSKGMVIISIGIGLAVVIIPIRLIVVSGTFHSNYPREVQVDSAAKCGGKVRGASAWPKQSPAESPEGDIFSLLSSVL
jgi:hypothetical protein